MLLDCNDIIPGRLWVGRFVQVDDVPRLRAIGIRTVLSLQDDTDLVLYGLSESRLTDACRGAGIEFRRVPVPDFNRRTLAERLPACVAEVEAALRPDESKVYLHCTAGINRAPTTAAAYLISSAGMRAREAYEFVCSRRSCSPYLSVLEEYEAALKGLKH